MGVISVPQEFKVAASPARMFKAVALQPANIWLTIMPNSIKSSAYIQGDGSPGSIRLITFADGSYMKNSVDAVDTSNLIYKFSLIEAPMLGDKIEKVNYEAKYEESGDGGCIIKTKSDYHTKAGANVTEDEIKASQDHGAQIYAATSQYLLDHPDVCA